MHASWCSVTRLPFFCTAVVSYFADCSNDSFKDEQSLPSTETNDCSFRPLGVRQNA